MPTTRTITRSSNSVETPPLTSNLSYNQEFWYNYHMKNHLAHLAEFNSLLANYTVSDQSKAILSTTKLVLMVGATSSGRNTIIKQLVAEGDYRFLVSDTTRAKRMNNGVMEQDGREYWFRSEEDMLEDVRAGRMLEAAVIHDQQVSGISIRELQLVHDQGSVGITDVEIVGVDNIVAAKPDTYAIFVLPPSFSQWQQRIHDRGAMPKDEFRRRMQSAVKEFKHVLAAGYYRFVINDDVEHAVDQVQHIVAGALNEAIEHKGQKLAVELLQKTKQLLTTL